MTVRYDRRTFLRTATGAVGFGSLSGYVGTLGMEFGESVRFGVMLPVSGSLEQVGTHDKRAAERVVKNINGADGVFGRLVELTIVDTEGSALVVADGYASLADAGAVGSVGGLVSDVSPALALKVAGDAVMETSPASTNPRLSDVGRADGRKLFGQTVPSDSLQATAIAKILDALQYVDADRAALLTVDRAFGSDLGTALGGQLDAEVVTEVSYDPGAEAFGDVIDEVFADSPDAVSFVSVPGQERGVLGAYSASDHETPWVFSAGLFDGETPPYYKGFYSASPSPVRTDGYFHLTQRLSDVMSLQSYAADAYDALSLMATAVEYADEASDPAIVDALQTVPGETGHTVSIGELDRVRTLVDAGHGLNYQGALSGVNFMEAFEPLSSYLVERVHNGSVEQVELFQRQFLESGGGR